MNYFDGVKSILSVDFDCIMYPCIKLYNEHITTMENPTVLWNNLERQYGINDHLSYDANLLRDIQSIMLKNISKGAKFIPIKNHDEIVKNDIVTDWISKNYGIILTNVDYHHDLGYDDNIKENIMEFDEYDCSNWVSYLGLKGVISSYYWMKPPTSDMISPDLKEDIFPDNEMVIQPVSKLLDIKTEYDVVFFALSEHWIPYKYLHLYDLITDSCKMMYDMVNSERR